ncbi:MAG: pyridoxamine 5'-phosphate oxidase family protein [Actinomycetota bacterium]
MTTGLRFIASRPIGVLASIGDDGYPHAVPVEILVDDGKVYTWCRTTARRVGFLRARPVASITAYRGNDFACARGPVAFRDPSWSGYERITAAFLDKYERDETYGNDLLVELDPISVISRVGD